MINYILQTEYEYFVLQSLLNYYYSDSETEMMRNGFPSSLKREQLKWLKELEQLFI